MIKIDYICTGIDNIKDFFGRQKLIDEINHRVKSGGSISLYGERKIGKTSLSIIALAGGHPFLIRLAYYHAVNLFMQSRNNRLDYDKLKLVFEKESFYAYFYDVWSHMDIDERKLLKKVSMGDIKDKLKLSQREMLENFLDNGLVLKEKDDCYSFVNSYFRELVQEWEVNGTQPALIEKPAAFDNEIFIQKLQRVEKSFAPPGKDAEEKGKALEEMAAYLFTSYKHYFDVRQQVQSRTSQLDIHLWFKPGDDPLLRKFGEEIIVECKNWQNPVGKPEINDLAGDMVNRKCKTGILISRKGIAGKDLKDANGQRLVWFHSEFNLIILVLSFEDMKKIEEGKNLIVLLKEKYQELVEGS